MQPASLRRYARRTQPRLAGLGHITHTSASATFNSTVQLSAGYLELLHESVVSSQVEQQAWSAEVLSLANLARETKRITRRDALDEANRRLKEHRQVQEQALAVRNTDRRARLAEIEERQRQEDLQASQQREEAARRRREEQIAAEEAERHRQARLRSCVICMDDHDLSLMAQTPCGHWSCRTCLQAGFEASFESRSRYQCCQQYVPVSLLANILTTEFVRRYELLVLELTTPNPTYCANPACTTFIPPANYFGPDSARCDDCFADTCRHCHSMDHVGRGCTTDQASEQVRALAAIAGWKACPACGMMVERRDGCLHMTCRCTTEFCYRCGGLWEECRSHCEGQYF